MSRAPARRRPAPAGRRAASLARAALLALAASAARAETSWDVAIGFDNAFRAGSWTPVVVAPAPGSIGVAPGDAIVVWADDPDGMPVRSPPAVLVTEPAGGAPRARTSVRIGRPDARILVEHLPGGTAVGSPDAPEAAREVRLPDPLPSTTIVLVAYGDLPALRRAGRLLPREEGRRVEVIVAAEADATPACGAAARDFDGADLIVVCGRAVAGIDADVLAGIDAWVRDGGRLVFVAGRSAADVSAAGGVAAGWLPAPVTDTTPLRGLAAVETFARAGGLAARPAAATLRVPVLATGAAVRGVVELAAGPLPSDLPLVVRRGHGLGTITWLAIDLDEEPCRSWPGADSLLVRLLAGRSGETEVARPASLAAGPPDLAGQLRVALEERGGRRGIAPFEIVLALGLVYVLCLYPLDWWLVSRGLGRPGLAWLTLPALVAAFTAAAWWIVERRLPPAAGMCRHAALVDVDAESGVIRGHAWAAVWRRDNGLVDLGVESAGPADISWLADAGTGFGAIDAAVAHPPLAAAPYVYGASLAALERVPVAAASPRLFEAAWTASTPTPIVTSSLDRDAQGTLRGSIAHHLPFALDDCRLLHAGWLWDIGRLAPGAAYDTSAGRGPRSLSGAVTRRQAVKEREVAVRWDPTGTDVARILEVAGFHAAAGGATYTGLAPGRLARLDCSPLLGVDRAVLMGTATTVPRGWTIRWVGDGATGPEEAARLYRIVIPLGPAAPASP